MSIMSNYQYKAGKITCIGDYKTHKGNPSLLRSDSMLKAIGKAINIRVSSTESVKIPIVILGNSPITENYCKKVDHLKEFGVIQQFISLNPNPIEEGKYIFSSPNKAFITIDEEEKLDEICSNLVNNDLHYFSSMKSKTQLGKIILEASKEKTNILRAEKFLQLLNK